MFGQRLINSDACLGAVCKIGPMDCGLREALFESVDSVRKVEEGEPPTHLCKMVCNRPGDGDDILHPRQEPPLAESVRVWRHPWAILPVWPLQPCTILMPP